MEDSGKRAPNKEYRSTGLFMMPTLAGDIIKGTLQAVKRGTMFFHVVCLMESGILKEGRRWYMYMS